MDIDQKLVVTAALGAIGGLAIGYFAYPYHSTGLFRWMTEVRPMDAVLWASFGAAVAVGLSYLKSQRTGKGS